GDRIVITVSDTGVGVSPEMLPRLFESFAAADDATTSKYGDPGLGLSLSLALCRMMNGDITGASKLGEGSCFTVTLPARPKATRRAKRRPATPDAVLAPAA